MTQLEHNRPGIHAFLAASIAGLCLLVLTSAASAAEPTAAWQLSVQARPSIFNSGDESGTARIYIRAINSGSKPADFTEPVTITSVLPPGLTLASEPYIPYREFQEPVCSGTTVVSCTFMLPTQGGNANRSPVQPGDAGIGMEVPVKVEAAAGSTLTTTARMEGGGAPGVSEVEAPIRIGAPGEAASFGIYDFEAGAYDVDGSTITQAGAHPHSLTTVLDLNTIYDPEWTSLTPPMDFEDVHVDLPAGFAGNPTAVPTCTQSQLNANLCPADTQLGVFAFGSPDGGSEGLPVYNMETNPGTPSQMAFVLFGSVVQFTAHLDPDPTAPGGYALSVDIPNNPTTFPLRWTILRLWGVPPDPLNDAARSELIPGVGLGWHIPSTVPPVPFLSNPSNCAAGPMETKAEINAWQEPGNVQRDSVLSHTADGTPIGFTGCDQVDFSPTIEARASTNVADSPAGLEVSIKVPQNEDPDGLAAAHLKDVTLTLPEGMTINASSANGLGSCAPGQIGLITPVGEPEAHFNGAPAACPDNSKLGTVEVDTPLLDHLLRGTVYLAEQGNNPFNSLLALYFTIEDPETGINIKLAGHPVADSKTGQLRFSFRENPQVPFNEFKVSFFTGPKASLKTPNSCGTFTSRATLTPWTSPEGAEVERTDSFQVQKGANDGSCVGSDSAAPNEQSFSAGTFDPTAAAYSPFMLRVARADGTQRIKGIDATLPKGLLGRLAGIPYCPDAAIAAAAGKSGKDEQSSPSCSSASQIGGVDIASGAGSTPFHTSGKAFLAGPYKGAPLSLAVITPVLAGPFDLGTVVTRVALRIDPEAAQVHAVSDPIPTILQGIPLDIRSITMKLDRDRFTLNPTSCDPSAVLASATPLFGSPSSLQSRFQVGGCGALPFKPKLALSLKGGTKRAKYPALTAKLTARGGEANIAKAVVTMPRSEFLAQNHIKTICTRVQFAADQCSPGAVYGRATATTPLLSEPLSGPVYLRSSSNKLPDLVVALDGQIEIDLVGRIDTVKGGGIRTSFESVPDAPVSSFVLKMAGGKKGLLQNSRNLCKSTNKAKVLLDGQNGRTADQTPVLANDCGKKAKKKGKKRKGSKGSKR